MYTRKESYNIDLLEAKNVKTSPQRLKELLYHHHGEIEMVEAIAANVSTPINELALIWQCIPKFVEKNPNFNEIKIEPKWESITSRAIRTSFSKWSSRINDRFPEIHIVKFIMENGEGAYQRWTMNLDLLPEWLISKYVSSKSAPLRKTIAARKTAPFEDFKKLVSDSAKTVRKVLAENQNAPKEILGILVNDSDKDVANAARINPSSPEDLVQKAKLKDAEHAESNNKQLKDYSFHELALIASDADINIESLIELSQHETPCIRFLAGLNVNATTELLERLATDSLPWVRACSAFNPNTPLTTLKNLLDDKETDIQLGLASNSSLPEKEQLILAEIADARAAEALANLTSYESVWINLSQSFDPNKTNKNWLFYLHEMVEQLKNNKFTGLTQGPKFLNLFSARMAARHENCPDKLSQFYATYIFKDYSQNPQTALALLEGKPGITPTKHQDWKVDAWFTERRAPGHVSNFYIRSDDVKRSSQAVSSPTTQVIYLLKFALNNDTNTRKRLAQRTDVPRFIYEILAIDEKPGVREKIAKNSATPLDLLVLLASDKATTVRTIAAKRVPKSKIAKDVRNKGLVNQGSATERARLAKNTTKLKELEELANDRAASVRAEVANNYDISNTLLSKLASDPDVKVRRIVAKRCKDSSIVLKMVNDGDLDVRLIASKNTCFRHYIDGKPEYDIHYLMHIANANDPEIRAITAGATNDEKLHEKYMKETEVIVLTALAKNPHFSESRKIMLAKQSSDHEVLGALIEKTKNEELFLIAAPKITNVQTRANDAVRCNKEMLSIPSVQDELCHHPSMNVRLALIGQEKLTDKATKVLSEDSNEYIRESLAKKN